MPGTEELDQYAPSRPLRVENIPMLDFGTFSSDDQHTRAGLIDQVRSACLKTGFFYVRNCGIVATTISAALDAMKRFFVCPDDGAVKQGVHNGKSGGKKGWGPMYSEPAYQQDTVANVESFDIGQPLSDEEYRLYGIAPNIWPDQAGFRHAISAYYNGVTALGRSMAEVFSEILGERPDFINRHSGISAPRTMRLLHYPASERPVSDTDVGIAAHTDFECFTIMYQSAEGLELTNVEGDWYQAPADSGSFTVILGDMLERFSNGHLRATGHRVVNTPWTRYSMVLFFALDGDYRVQPLPRFIHGDSGSRYRPITQDAHITRELERVAVFSKHHDRS